MMMSRGAESIKSKEEKGVANTEVPTKVHGQKKKILIHLFYSYLKLPITFKSSLSNDPGLTKTYFTLSSLLR